MTFEKFSKQIDAQFTEMSSHNLLTVNVTRDELWDTYQAAFPTGTNEIYKERPKHDCNTCKQFIRNIGSVVAIINDEVVSIWDANGLDGEYQVVAETMSNFIKSRNIDSPFIRGEKKYGQFKTNQLLEDNSVITWDHFQCNIPNANFSKNSSADISKVVSTVGVFKRGMEEIELDYVNDVLDLINNNSIYRGEEHLKSLQGFKTLLTDYKSSTNKDVFIWNNYKHPSSRLRNSVIGSLLTDLSSGMDLEGAVKSFEAKVAPSNYQRPKSLVTKKMIDEAIKTIDALGIREALPRRQATPNDISINNVLFADRSTKLKDRDPLLETLGVKEEPKISTKAMDNAPEITMDELIEKVIPKTKELKLLSSGRLNANQIYLSAPVNSDAPNILKWDNNFSWSYNGNVADSEISKNVAAKGGDLEGILRFSLQWNENDQDNTDLDAHCIENCNGRRNEIYYSEKTSNVTGGKLDIDIQSPGGKVAVENIVWKELKNGTYKIFVRDYSGRGLRDKFTCEIVFNDTTYSYEYNGNMAIRDIEVAVVTYTDGVIDINHTLKPQVSMDNHLIPVKMVCYSPNHWDDNAVGNKHYIFVTDETKAEEPFRGYYNEFLSNELNDNRKVFDMLSSKMMCEPTMNGLAGYGFSSTKHNNVFIKADAKLYKVKV